MTNEPLTMESLLTLYDEYMVEMDQYNQKKSPLEDEAEPKLSTFMRWLYIRLEKKNNQGPVVSGP